MSTVRSLALAATLLATLGAPLAGAGGAQAETTALDPVAGTWMVRGRVLVVQPDEDARLSAGGARIPGADVGISTSVVPELDISYFFTPNLAAELVLGVTPHKVKGTGSLGGAPIGKTLLLPPTLLAQYHFTGMGMVKPYVGAGLNYTMFLDEKARGGFTSFDLDNAVGYALQVGVDVMLDPNWGLNLDLKKLFLSTDVSVNAGAVRGEVDIDPWLIGVGVSYRF